MAISEQNKEKIERTREYLLKSKLPEDSKDNLSSLLDAAGTAANGAPDKIQAMSDLMLLLILHEVRRDIRLPQVVDEAVQLHATKCPMAAPGGWIGVVYRLRWPLCAAACVAFVSPNFLLIAEVIKGLWRN